MRLHVYERARQVGGWRLRETLVAHGRAHFEYGQRTPVARHRAATHVTLPGPFYALGEHFGDRPRRRAGRVHDSARRLLFRAVRVAQPRPPDRRSARGGRAQPRRAARSSWACSSPTSARSTAPRSDGSSTRRSSRPIRSSCRECDGQATALPGVAPMVMTADCLPVAVAGAGAVAMLHAGWRGLAGGILAEGVDAVRELGAEGALRRRSGPGPVRAATRSARRSTPRSPPRTWTSGAVATWTSRRSRARSSRRAGVDVVHDVGLCTICCDPTLLFSHRRDRGITGRQAGVAWLS